MSSYPGAIDALTNPISTDAMNSVTVPHATQHANANDAIEAIQGELGTDPAGASATVKARLDTLDTTVSAKAPSADPTFTGTVVLPSTTSVGTVSSTEIGYLDGLTEALSTSLAGKAPLASPEFTGNMAIGTTSQTNRPLSIYSAAFANLELRGDGNTQMFFQRSSTDTSAGILYMDKARGTTASRSIVAADDLGGAIVMRAYDGASFQNVAGIYALVDGTPGAGDMPGRLVFYTVPDGSTTLTERMRISQDGAISGSGPSLGAWTAFSPTLSNWGIGSGTIAAVYCKIGKTVHVRYVITFAADSTFASYPYISLPVTASAGAGDWITAHGRAKDASTGSQYIISSTSTTTALYPMSGSPVGTLGSSTPFTWTTSDVLSLQVTYEAA